MSAFSINSEIINMPGTKYKINEPKNISESQKKELKKLSKACKDFESIFMDQMLKEMKKTVHKTKLINGGQAEDIFSDMLDQERAKKMSIGLGDILYKQLSRSIVPPKRPL